MLITLYKLTGYTLNIQAEFLTLLLIKLAGKRC